LGQIKGAKVPGKYRSITTKTKAATVIHESDTNFHTLLGRLESAGCILYPKTISSIDQQHEARGGEKHWVKNILYAS